MPLVRILFLSTSLVLGILLLLASAIASLELCLGDGRIYALPLLSWSFPPAAAFLGGSGLWCSWNMSAGLTQDLSALHNIRDTFWWLLGCGFLVLAAAFLATVCSW